MESARKIARIASSAEYAGATFIEARRGSKSLEAIELEVEVSLGQAKLVHDIRRRERVAVVCLDGFLPSTFSLRTDFPDLPHLNSADKEIPRTFCLTDLPESEIERIWTGLWYVEKIRWWFEKNAYGELHGEAQPLDPILHGGINFTLVVPDRLLDAGFSGRVTVEQVEPDENQIGVLLLHDARESKGSTGGHSSVVVLVSQPRQHGRLRHAPANLQELRNFDEEFGIDILATLKAKLLEWVSEKQDLLNKPLLIILTIPLEREAGKGAEGVSIRAFWTPTTAGEVGKALGVLDIESSTNRWVRLLTEAPQGALDKIALEVGDVRRGFNREHAASAAGRKATDLKVVQIGVGALGSQLAKTLGDEGFGRWTLIDKDRLMPHNLARHALPFFCVGRYKAPALSFQMCATLDDPDFARSIVCDVLNPEGKNDELDTAFKEADVILDASASVAVSRNVAIEAVRDRLAVSIFFNPSGTDVVILSEGKDQSVRLDDVEMSYYLALLTNKNLQGHLTVPAGGLLNGTACREPSMEMPQSRVIKLVGVAADQVRQAINSPAPRIAVWGESQDGLVEKHSYSPPPDIKALVLGGWEIRCPQKVLDALQIERGKAGTVETGGVLIGAWDRKRKIIYVTIYLGPPHDSIQTPSGFVRGKSGLSELVSSISEVTFGNLGYVGEWHTHPGMNAANLSADDRNFLHKMKELTVLEDSPTLMFIAGNDGVRCAVMNPDDRREESALFREV
ncbi:MAG: ThiF family adenylyltransferase [Alphaproteobacteria bacterium]